MQPDLGWYPPELSAHSPRSWVSSSIFLRAQGALPVFLVYPCPLISVGALCRAVGLAVLSGWGRGAVPDQAPHGQQLCCSAHRRRDFGLHRRHAGRPATTGVLMQQLSYSGSVLQGCLEGLDTAEIDGH